MVLPRDFSEARRRVERLASRTSLAVGGKPDFLFEPQTEDEAVRIVRVCREHGVPLRYLGGGYNLLIGEGRIQGAVLATRRLCHFRVHEDRVEVGAGNSFPSLVRQAITLGIPALPGCPGIPGSVGGVVFMNAGGRFGAVSDALVEVTYLDPAGEVRRMQPRRCDFGYRSSPFEGCLVTGAAFRRDPSLTERSQRTLFDTAMRWKRDTQPLSAKSAGCIFKNPQDDEKRSAGYLIEHAGLKGRAIGGARVSPIHANFIENVDGATADDVQDLIRLIRRTVLDKFGVELELEVQTWR